MKIVLAGNQNSGKTSLFNALTGGNQKVGNWAGVTLERKEGVIKHSKDLLIDTPGVYSLTAFTPEEGVTGEFLASGEYDTILNIVDATSLERSLFLTTQLMEFGKRVVIALNMWDILEKSGLTIDVTKLEKRLGVEIVAISASKRKNLEKLVEVLSRTSKQREVNVSEENAYKNIFKKENLGEQSGDASTAFSQTKAECENLDEAKTSQRTATLKTTQPTKEQEIAKRYEFIQSVCNECVSGKRRQSVSQSIDKIILNKWLALPIFAIIMLGVYFLSVGVVGKYTVDLVALGIDKLSESFGGWLTSVGASSWSVSLVVDGIFAGVGAVLGFVPQLIILFLLITLLETTGYMARIAFTFDRIFRKIGLSGKSLIPFIIGSGCSVPAIMATRTVENKDERIRTAILTPFIPCSAKLPIIALFSGYFFKGFGGLISASLYFVAIVIIILSAIVMKKFSKGRVENTFMFELSEYKMPKLGYLTREVSQKVAHFITRAGTIIFLSSVVLWLLLSFDFKFNYGGEVGGSMLATIGKGISWIFYPMLGTNSWEAAVSALQGLVAKEQVVSGMAVIAGLADGEGILSSNVFAFFNGASAYSFMVFNLFSAPCIGAIGAMKKELGAKRAAYAVLFQTLLALLLSYAVFGIGSLFLNGAK